MLAHVKHLYGQLILYNLNMKVVIYLRLIQQSSYELPFTCFGEILSISLEEQYKLEFFLNEQI